MSAATEHPAGRAPGPGGEADDLVVVLVAAPGRPAEAARELLGELEAMLGDLRADARARICLEVDATLAAPAPAVELVQRLRRRLLAEDWDLAVGLVDLPLELARRPVAGHASPTHGVGLLSLPAIGPGTQAGSLREALRHVIEELLGEHDVIPEPAGGTERMRRRAHDLRRVGDEDGGYGVVLTGGYLRLLAGLVWDNEPWRFAARLSRALIAALAAVAFTMITPDLWLLSDALGTSRLVLLTALSVIGTTAALIAVHGLWERSPRPGARAQVALTNLATLTTVVIGVMTLYLTLLALSVGAAALLLPAGLLEETIGHPVDTGDYLKLAWLISSLGTVGGALGGSLELETSVREATYASDAEDDAED